MVKPLRKILIVYLSIFLYTYNCMQGFADPSLDETKALLQKSLTIIQLNDEISRLTIQDSNLTVQINHTRQNLTIQNEKVGETRVHAGKVLREYYMGDRDSLWLLLFSAKSFSDAIALSEYLNIIAENDHIYLNAYLQSYQKLQALHTQLLTTQSTLRDIKQQFIAQRDHALALQQQVDEKLSQLPQDQAQAIQAKINELKVEWNTRVLPLFEKYFTGIGNAMPLFVNYALIDHRDKYLQGLTFQVQDEDLSQFFRTVNKDLFDHLTFQFQNNEYTVIGVDGDINASIKGHYTVEENPNRLQFHVDELAYNGNVLDETTDRSMETKFNLSLSVEKYTQGQLQATAVSTNNGMLQIQLKLAPKLK